MSRRMRLTRAAIAVVAMLSVPAPAQEAAAAPIERRLASMKTLVESSSAARRIEASGNRGAAGYRAEARELLRLAEQAHASRDERSAATLLDGAARQMLEGVRLASGEGARSGKLERDVAARIEAAEALLAAQKRIAAEKSAAGASQSALQVERLLGEARAELAAHRPAQAQPLAQQAYLLAKASIGAMRGGDTLVRTLDFASKEEEYRYELDRYETHRMLHALLARKQPGDDALARGAMARAAELRGRADAAAGRADYGAAVGYLEDATRELVRAIRAAGVFIPG
jgi:hypothetical protein